MKNALIICAAIALVASGLSVSASAADGVPAATLGNMGFGGVQVLSDDAGYAIRGMGTSVQVWGSSRAAYYGPNASGADTDNNYNVSSSKHYGRSFAAGGSDSYAGKVRSFGPFTASTQYVSGGSAWGAAH